MNENQFKLEYITTNSNFLKEIDKKMNELKKNEIFMKKNIARKILLFYSKFKISLESSKYRVPLWQYNFFNTILETPTNNIENAIRELNNNIAIAILRNLLSEMGFSNFSVFLDKGQIILNIISNLKGNPPYETCFGLIINIDNIDIDCLSRCALRGSESLKIIGKLAERMPNIKYITLIDLSDINILSSDKYINLAILKILTKGQSWYNSFGYFSDDDEEEKKHNKKIIDGNYLDFVSNLIKKLGKKGENSIELPIIIEICHELYPPLISQSVKDYFNHIWTEIEKSEEKSKNNWFAKYLIIISNANILKYSKSLTKYVRLD